MYRRSTAAIGFSLSLAILLGGCAQSGPRLIRDGRLAYNSAITDTQNEQILLAVVRSRYGEPSTLLDVASVTANIRVGASGSVEIGVGDGDNYEGNLVPFSAGGSYEENPTISYVPVAGSHYRRQFMSPLPIAAVAQLAGTLAQPEPVLEALIGSINGVQNLDFLDPGASPDLRFGRVMSILGALRRSHSLHWGSADEVSFVLNIDTSRPGNSELVAELAELLELALPTDSRTLSVPVSLALDSEQENGIALATRSVMQLAELLTAAVEVPDGRLQAAVTYPPVGPLGSRLRVAYSAQEPASASTAVPFRGGWYSIDDADLDTKLFFRVLVALWSSAIADANVGGSARPVLTVPVSR